MVQNNTPTVQEEQLDEARQNTDRLLLETEKFKVAIQTDPVHEGMPNISVQTILNWSGT